MSAAAGSGGSTDRTTPPSPQPLSSSVLGIAIIAITGMQLMSTLDGTIVIVALPRMQAELDLSDAAKSWVITAYVLTFGGLLLLGGRVGDAIGHKRAFLSGVGVFTIASLVCGILGFICFLGAILGGVAIILGVSARRKIKESGGAETGDGLALAGIIIGSVFVVLQIGFFALALVGSSNNSNNDNSLVRPPAAVSVWVPAS